MRIIWLLSLVVLLLPRPAAGQAYRIVDLGISDPYFPTALNNRGQILLTNNHLTPASIGLALQGGGAGTWVGAASVLWDNGATSAIGLLPGGTYSRGCGLNDAGQVAGFGDTLWTFPGPVHGSLPVLHAFVWQGGGLTDLEPKETVDSGETVFKVPIGSFATGINNQGKVTGAMTARAPNPDDGAVVHAFRTAGGLIDHDADDLSVGDPSFTRGWLINNAGAVLGIRSGPDGGGRSYVLFGGGGSLPPAGAAVYAMNDRGAIVGVSGERAFVAGAGGGLQTVPFPGASAALGINNQGQIVGTGESGDGIHAFLLDGGESVDLNDRLLPKSGWELKSAYGINDKGQIVGYGLHDGKLALFFLTPEEIDLTINVQPPKGCGGETRKVAVQVQPPAPAGGLEVHLAATPELKELPETVAFEEGETYKTVEVTVPAAADTVRYQIEASIQSESGHAIVSGTAALVVDPPELTELKLSDDQVCSDDVPTGTVTLSCLAPKEGITVTLQSKTFSGLQIKLPPTVKVEAGKTSATFPITPGFYLSKFSEETVTIKATYRDVTRSTDLKVQPTIDSLKLAPQTVTGGESATARIHLNCLAPKGGRVVLVRSLDPSVAFVNAVQPDKPLLFLVPEGSELIQVKVQTRAVTAPQTVTIGAGTPASSDSDDLTVRPPR